MSRGPTFASTTSSSIGRRTADTREPDPAATAEVDRLRLSPAAGCGVSLGIGLALACLVSAVLLLGLRGEIVLHRGLQGESRIWLINSETESGLGVSWVSSVPSRLPDVECEATRVYFLLWASQGDFQPLTICECYDRALQGIVDEGACPS
jgi:hypothetical protein